MTPRLVTRADLTCFLCARTVATVQDRRVRVLDPEHTESVRRLRCPHCGGRLSAADIDQVTVFDRQPSAAVRPNRGRPSRTVESRAASNLAYRELVGHPCADCGVRLVAQTRVRCRECWHAHLAEGANAERLVDLLSSAEPVHHQTLVEALGVSEYAFRNAIHKARMRGHQIVLERPYYRLEMET